MGGRVRGQEGGAEGGDQKTSLDAKLLKMPAVTTRMADGK